jgi:hypothetical protein
MLIAKFRNSNLYLNTLTLPKIKFGSPTSMRIKLSLI